MPRKPRDQPEAGAIEMRPADWFAAQYRGERRSLPWYIERARSGDRAAAARALQLALGSIEPAAIRENGGMVTPEALAFLKEALAPVVEAGDSPLLRLIRQPPANRPADDGIAWRDWWLCVEMGRRIKAAGTERRRVSQREAAEAVLGEMGGAVTVNTLIRKYAAARVAVCAYLEFGGK